MGERWCTCTCIAFGRCFRSNLRDELCSLPVSLMQLFVTRDAPCYWPCLPVSSCRMTSNEHEVPVFTVQSPTLHVVPLLSMQSKG